MIWEGVLWYRNALLSCYSIFIIRSGIQLCKKTIAFDDFANMKIKDDFFVEINQHHVDSRTASLQYSNKQLHLNNTPDVSSFEKIAPRYFTRHI